MNKVKNKYIKILLTTLGTLSLILGILGIILPLLPTTPFLLLSAYLYSKSSDKFYNTLINNKYLGKYIKNYREGNGITLKTKIISITTIWLAIFINILYFVDLLFIEFLLTIIGISVSLYLITLKTLEP